MFLFKNYIFCCFFLFVIAKVCVFSCRLTGATVDSDERMGFSLLAYQVTTRNYTFRISIYVVYTNFFLCAPHDK